jgi:hypothetical protein
VDRRDNNPRNSSGGYRRPPRRDQYATDREDYQATARLPEIYYRRRRVAAVVAILLVVIVVVAVLARMSRNSISTPVATETAIATSTSAKPTKTSTEEATSSSSETASGSATDSKAEEVTESASATAEPTEAITAKGSCDLNDLVIEASADHPNYHAGDLPSFFMTVRNPTDTDCEIDLGQQPLRFEVYTLDTNQRVWADIDCNDPIGTGVKVFKAGEERYYKTQWSRLYSDPQTCTGREEVAPGGYYLHTVIGDNASAPFAFNLGG